jgi:hypothetical protein
LTTKGVRALALVDGNIIAGTAGGGAFRSTDGGASWTSANNGLDATYLYAFASRGSNLFVTSSSGRVYLTSNGGTSWISVEDGLPQSDIWAAAADSTTVYVGTRGNGVLRRPLTQMITSIPGSPPGLPREFWLEQNYPNPFNPTTVISFVLPAASQARLEVYDLLGRRTALLLDERKGAGRHEVRFDASGLTSGVYIYRLTAGLSVQARKMVIVK